LPKAPDSGGEKGFVRELDGNYAVVELSIQEACEHCGARVLCIPNGSGKHRIRVLNDKGAREGQWVEIGESESFLLKVSAIQYGIPFLGFLTGIFLVYGIAKPVSALPIEVEMFIAGLAGLFLGGYIGHYLLKQIAQRRQTVFSILRIIKSGV
jgi:positive regulator of sigma E activity